MCWHLCYWAMGWGRPVNTRHWGFDQLITTFGDSTPMGVLWKFMKASQPYTAFAAICEVGALVLLLWQRTASLALWRQQVADAERSDDELLL